MAGLTVTVAETAYAVTSAEVKQQLRIDGSDDDNVIDRLVIASHNWAKRYTHRSITTQTLKLSIDSIYDADIPIREGMYIGIDQDITRRSIILPESPVASISSVKYYDDADTESTFASSKYYLDSASVPARLILRQGESYPTGLRVANAIEITYVAGYGGASDVPADIKQACLTYVAYMFEHRGDLLDGKNVLAPTLATQLLQPYVIRQFSTNPYRGTAHYGGMI
jgi:uncharacterized phiE125 gp8 family phage protein